MNIKTVILCAAAFGLPGGAWAQAPDFYPADYSKIVEAGAKEGKLVIYNTLDLFAMRPLIDDFNSMYPDIVVEYNDISSTVLHNRFISEAASGGSSADIVSSTGADLQFQLVNDGYALSYASPEIPNIPKWAVWENQAYGTTFEPVVFVYNKGELTPEQVPQSHADVAKILTDNADLFQGRVVNYDIEKSGIGFLTVAMDSELSKDFWDIPAAFGKVDARYISGSGQMIESVSSGENLFAYNQIGSYARRVMDNPDVGIVFPKDYTLVVSRIMFIAKNSAHPNAAKLWLDYTLSARGQTKIMNEGGLYSLRADVAGEYSASGLTEKLGDSLKAIPVGPELLKYLDEGRRTEFLMKWKQATTGGN